MWAATHLVTRKPVALKFLKSASKEATWRFLREARITVMLGHPNIVEVQDVFQLPDGTPAMVMELLAGEALDVDVVLRQCAPLLGVSQLYVGLRHLGGEADQCIPATGLGTL